MRIRQIKPSFWSDARLAALAPAVRLFYIGLWQQADDAGWLRWDPAQLAMELYGYEGRRVREKHVAAYGDALEEAGRIERLDCGHAHIPTLTGHQRLSGPTRVVKTVEKEHSRCSPRVPALPRASPPGTVRNGSGSGTERLGTVSSAQARENDDDLMASYRRQGLPVDTPRKEETI